MHFYVCCAEDQAVVLLSLTFELIPVFELSNFSLVLHHLNHRYNYQAICEAVIIYELDTCFLSNLYNYLLDSRRILEVRNPAFFPSSGKVVLHGGYKEDIFGLPV